MNLYFVTIFVPFWQAILACVAFTWYRSEIVHVHACYNKYVWMDKHVFHLSAHMQGPDGNLTITNLPHSVIFPWSLVFSVLQVPSGSMTKKTFIIPGLGIHLSPLNNASLCINIQIQRSVIDSKMAFLLKIW